VGGVSEGAGAKAGGSNLSATDIPSRDVTVKDILVDGKAALFAGRRRKVGLDRSASLVGLQPAERRADDSGCPKDAEEGNVVGLRQQHVGTPTRGRAIVAAPRGRVLHSVLRPVHVDPHYAPGQKLGGGASEAVSRSGKPARAGGTGTGTETDERSAARRATPLPQGRGRVA